MFSAVFACLFVAFMSGAAVAACASNEIDVADNGSNCQTSKFEVTTTSLVANGTFKFAISAEGTFYVDCGDGGSLSGTGASGKTISKSTNFSVSYTCTWTAAGAHTVKFAGAATEYSTVGLDVTSDNAAITFYTSISNNATKIASVSGSLAAVFPQLGSSASQIPQFIDTFKGATNLTSIPSTLFSGGNLTGGSNAKYVFYQTFEDCTGLTAMPAGLFAEITSAGNSMFSNTFNGCSSLSGFIPSTTFAGLVANNAPTATNMWNDTFNGTQLATACPNGLPQYYTGYEGNANNTTWNGKVSCGCMPGYHVENGVCVACSNKPANSTYVYDSTAIACPWECVTGYSLHENLCLAHYDDVCPGDQFYEITLDACTACPSGYTYNTNPGKRSVTECQIHCDAGTYVKVAAPVGYTKLEYLKKTSTAQYIDTGITADKTTTVDVEVSFGSVSGTYVIVGTRNGTNTTDNNVFQWGVISGKTFNRFGVGTPTGDTISENTLYKVHIEDGLQTITSNGLPIATTNFGYKSTMNTSGTLYMYCTHDTTLESQRTFCAPINTYIKSMKISKGGIIVRDFVPVRRDSDGVLGMYDFISGTFFENNGSGTFVAGADAGSFDSECVNVGAGYYAGASTVNYGSSGTRTACPAGLTTVGYGHGADSANDCARTLHIGDKVLYGRRDKVTNPSLNIKLPNEDVYYVSLSPNNHNLSRLHLSFNGNEYTAYDDSLFYGERNFDTNAHVTQ